jgi:membrane-associated phospholipid phosphatase
MERRVLRTWSISIITATVGVWWQFYSLALIERYVTSFPTVNDILLEALPLVQFGLWGEAWFFLLIGLFAVDHFRFEWRRTPEVLMTLGTFYFVRGWFMFLFPIGAPTGALDASQRLNIWGHASHAYFPGGHIGILTILTLLTPHRTIRHIMWFGVVVFGLGTLLSKNHYTMDSVAGVMLGAGTVLAIRRLWTYIRGREVGD